MNKLIHKLSPAQIAQLHIIYKVTVYRSGLNRGLIKNLCNVTNLDLRSINCLIDMGLIDYLDLTKTPHKNEIDLPVAGEFKSQKGWFLTVKGRDVYKLIQNIS